MREAAEKDLQKQIDQLEGKANKVADALSRSPAFARR